MIMRDLGECTQNLRFNNYQIVHIILLNFRRRTSHNHLCVTDRLAKCIRSSHHFVCCLISSLHVQSYNRKNYYHTSERKRKAWSWFFRDIHCSRKMYRLQFTFVSPFHSVWNALWSNCEFYYKVVAWAH